EVFNAGVMLLNIPVLRRLNSTVVDFTIADDFANGSLGWYDQSVLNMLFRAHRVTLPQSWNWRPFAKPRLAPRIMHFQLLKPADIIGFRQSIDSNLKLT